MRLKYDLHIHSALSPCGHRDMTPNNIVNMACLNQLKAIAITDHNSCGNVKAVMEVAQNRELIVIPAMEVETKEEIHVVCLFFDLNSVYKMQNIVHKHLPNRKNVAHILGEQYLLDKQDQIIGLESQLLLTATQLTINEVLKYTHQFNGIMIPAHIDRPSYSIISNLGIIPEDLDVNVLEISRHTKKEAYVSKYDKYMIIQSSDAHELGYVGVCENSFEVEQFSIESVLKALKY
jgi:hypothetical protein